MTTPRAPHPSRRSFMHNLGLASVASVAATASAAPTYGWKKNDTVRIGLIGCGGRMTHKLLPGVLRVPGTEIVAVCDIFTHHRSRAVAEVEKRTKKKPQAFKHHEQLLAMKDVDAVVVATPDHWHVPITIDACAAGKDVYCEKPLTHKLEEGKAVVAAQNKHKAVVQVGTQQRSMPQFAEAKKIIDSGDLGEVHKIHMTWNRNSGPFRKRVPNIKQADVDWKRFLGNAPDQPFDPYRLIGNWRWFWDFGGGILTDLMVHWLDAANYLLDLPMPSSATSIGGMYQRQGAWETPDTIQTLMDYPDRKLQVHFEGTFVNRFDRAHLLIMGTKANLYLDRGRFELTPEPIGGTQPKKKVYGVSPRGADFDSKVEGETMHITDWVNAIRARRKPSTPAEAGVIAATASQMANKAFREGRVIKRQDLKL